MKTPEHMSNITWKTIEGLDGRYEVSSSGLIRDNIKGRLLKFHKDKDGYLICSINGKRRKVHRLVCTAFIDNPYGKETVNHINGIKQDNRVDNLEWSTRSENMYHAYKLNLKKPVSFKGEKNSSSKLSNEDIIEIRNTHMDVTLNTLAEKYNVSSSLIGQIRRGIIWKHII